MQENKSFYNEARDNFLQFVNELLVEIASFDSEIGEQKAKDCVFRINRDIRFSKDKSPYKVNFGAAISPGGRKSFIPGYYIHLQPGDQTFTAGGAYMPPADYLKSIRQEIDYNTAEFEGILNKPSFKSTFPKLEGDKLKTAPKGYEKDHPAIDLLRHKSFIVFSNIADKKVLNGNVKEIVIEQFKELVPFNHFLRRAHEDLV